MLRRITSLSKYYRPSTSLTPLSSLQSIHCNRFSSEKAKQNEFDRQHVGALDELERTFVEPQYFVDTLQKNDLHFYTGVPDSLLKDLCGYITDNVQASNHMIVPNEGSAIGVASGYHLQTGRIPVVYFQNSGLGNAVNPLLSLTHNDVYSIPLLLLIGWRGEVGKKDEPQHIVMGRVMTDMLKSMQIPYDVLPDYEGGVEHSVQTACQYMRNNNAPYALLVRKRTFETYHFESDLYSNEASNNLMSRREVLKIVLNTFDQKTAFVSTTGFTSREMYEIRKEYQTEFDCKDVKEFLTVGSMGHSSCIALGIAHATNKRNVVSIDGDGALLMHMGAMSLIGNSNVTNYKHILINNGCHDSVGGQPTHGFLTDFVQIAKACGYKYAKQVQNEADIIDELKIINEMDGPCFLEIITRPGAAKNLSRPKSTPVQNKREFMQFLDS